MAPLTPAMMTVPMLLAHHRSVPPKGFVIVGHSVCVQQQCDACRATRIAKGDCANNLASIKWYSCLTLLCSLLLNIIGRGNHTNHELHNGQALLSDSRRRLDEVAYMIESPLWLM